MLQLSPPPSFKSFGLLKQALVILCFLSFGISVNAKDYYISSSIGNDAYTSTQAQSQATPWKSIAKLNSFFNSIVAGDNIYFKRGDTFFGCIVVTKSGASGNLITIGAYGTGSKPVISGLITLSSWSAVGGGIYQAAAPAVKSTVNLVTLNGTPQGVGRYPNADAANGGYLTYEGYGTNSIRDDQLTGVTNWTGAEVVIRKQHFSMERCKITAQTGNIINYAALPSINPASNATPTPIAGIAGYGYFIQRDPRTLDEMGEWYFNPSSKNLQMFFGSNNPSSYTIKVSTLDTLINIGNKSYINVNNITFEGANAICMYAANSGNLTVQACDMNLMGGKGILVWASPNILIDGLTTSNILCNAIDLTSRYQGNATITNCNIQNTGMIAGMGSFWDDNDYKGISVTVNSGATLQYNSIDHSGFVGVQFQGNNVLIANNFINYYDIVKDDGGGIYTYQSGTTANPGMTYTNRVIRSNIVMNGIGAENGTGGDIDVDGIFLDGQSMNVNVLNNTIANIGVNGIYSNNADNVTIRGNTCFNNGNGIGLTKYSWGSITNLSVTKNIFYPKYPTQTELSYVNTGVNIPVVSTIQTAMQQIGKIDSNYYSTPNAAGFTYFYSLIEGGTWVFPKPNTFESWKAITLHDKASTLTAAIPGYKLNGLLSANMVTNGDFASNIGNTTVWTPNTNIISSWDNTGKITGPGSLKITPLLPLPQNTFVYGSVGTVSSAKSYILRFTTVGSSESGFLRAYIRKGASPQTILTPIQLGTFGKAKTVHEYLFTAPANEAAADYLIEIEQNSGTTYVDDISFYEANATVLDIDSQLKFEYNPTTTAKTYTLDATYVGIDNTSYNGSITLQPYTSSILLKTGPTTAAAVPPVTQTLTAAATVPAISCFGDNTVVTVAGASGTAPYAGAGQYTVNAGKGSLKISVAAPVANASTYIYSTIGAIDNSKTYIFRFSVYGTTTNGSLDVYLRQTVSPFSTLTPVQTKSFGIGRTDYQFVFTAPASSSAASFLISLDQSSGTTYFDNIAFFQATSTGILTSDNLYKSGQFEGGDLSGITTWSNSKNHTATLDLTSKISNTYYYPVKDANGAIATATAATIQPAAALSVGIATSGNITSAIGTTNIVVTASGGTAPYTGTGSFPGAGIGHYYFTVTDAKGCSVTKDLTLAQSTGSRIATTSTDSLVTAEALTSNAVILADAAPLKISTYPNPTNTDFSLMVEGGSSDAVNISVASVDGRVVYKAQGASNKKYSFGNNFVPGVYIIQVIQGNTVQTLKAVKAK